MKKQAVILGALAVGGFLAYKHFSASVVQADFMGYAILKRSGYFLAKHLQTGAVSPDMQDLTTVQKWIGAQKASSALKSWLPGIGDDMLMPPPGRTITADGQVLGDLDGFGNFGRRLSKLGKRVMRIGVRTAPVFMIPRVVKNRGFKNVLGDLGMETTRNDVYDAAPYQYSSTPQNDFVPGINGFGSSFKKAVSKAGKTVAKVAAAPANIINKSPILKVLAMPVRLSLSTVKVVGRSISNPAAGFKMAARGLKSFTITPLKQTGMVLGIVKPPKQASAPSGGVEYRDSEGNLISKEDYDKLLQASQRATPVIAKPYKGYVIWTMGKPEGGTVYLINYSESDNSTEGAYDTMVEAEAAIDAVSVPASAPDDAPTSAPSGSTYDQAKQRYDAEAAAREQASMSQAQDDSGYGNTSKDDGTAPLPERVASVQTPSAVMQNEAPPLPEAPPRGDGKVGLLVGGGVLAAIAAAVMSK